MWHICFEFAKTGKPKYVDGNGKEHLMPPASSENEAFLEVLESPLVKSGFQPNFVDFWAKTFEEHFKFL